MAMTLIGYRGFTRRAAHRRDRPVRGTAGTHDETGPDAEHAPHCRAREAPWTYPPAGPVTQTARQCEAETGQQGKDRGQTPPSRRARSSAATRTYLAGV